MTENFLFNKPVPYVGSEKNIDLRSTKLNDKSVRSKQEDFFDQFEDVTDNDASNQVTATNDNDFFSQFEDAEPTNTTTWTDRAKELGQGIGVGLGSSVDLVNKYIASPIVGAGAKVASSLGLDKAGESLSNLSNTYSDSNLSEQIKNSDILKTQNTPDNLSDIYTSVGEGLSYIVPGNLLGKGLQVLNAGKAINNPIISKLSKIITTPLNTSGISSAIGASAGSTIAQQQLGNSETNTPTEIVTASILGGLFGGISLSLGANLTTNTLKSISQTAINTFSHPEKALKHVSIKELTDLLPSDIIDKKTIDMLTKTGDKIDIPHVFKEDKLPAVIGAILPDKILKDSLITLNKSSIKTVESNLDKYLVNLKDIPQGDVMYTQLTSNLEKAAIKAKDTSSHLYKKAESFVTANDYIEPIQIRTKIKDIEPLYTALSVNSEERGTVRKLLQELDLHTSTVSPIDSNSTIKKIPLEKAILQRRALNSIYRSVKDNNAEAKDHIRQILKAFDEDIMNAASNGTLQNEKFINSFKEANTYYKEVTVPVVKTDISKTILSGEKPYYVFDLLKEPNGIQKFNNLITDIKRANPTKSSEIDTLSKTLKRAKLQEFIFEKTRVDLNSDKINTRYMESLFNTETGRNTMRELAGEELYNILRKHNNDTLPTIRNLEKLIKNNDNSPLSNITNVKTLKDAGKLAVPAYVLGAKPIGLILGGKLGLNFLMSKINSDETLMKMFIKRMSKDGSITKEMITFLKQLSYQTGLHTAKEVTESNKSV